MEIIKYNMYSCRCFEDYYIWTYNIVSIVSDMYFLAITLKWLISFSSLRFWLNAFNSYWFDISWNTSFIVFISNFKPPLISFKIREVFDESSNIREIDVFSQILEEVNQINFKLKWYWLIFIIINYYWMIKHKKLLMYLCNLVFKKSSLQNFY